MKQIQQMANSVRYNFDNGLTVSAILDDRTGMITAETAKITESARSSVRRITVIYPNEKLGADAFADYLHKVSHLTPEHIFAILFKKELKKCGFTERELKKVGLSKTEKIPAFRVGKMVGGKMIWS